MEREVGVDDGKSPFMEAESLLSRELGDGMSHRVLRAIQKGRSERAGSGIIPSALQSLCSNMCSSAIADPQGSDSSDLVQALLVLVQTCDNNRRSAASMSTRLFDCLVGLMARGSPKARVSASGILSQIVLVGHAPAHACCSTQGFLQTLTMHMCTGEDESKNQAAILVNNCAAMGGANVCTDMSWHSGLIGALKSLLVHGEEPQRSRAAGAFMLLSHSHAARKHLLRGRVDDSLEHVTLEACDDTDQCRMLHGIAAMALVNLTCDQTRRAAIHRAIMPIVVEFLQAAVTARPLYGMLWRADDALWTLQALASVQEYHPLILRTASLESMHRLLTSPPSKKGLPPFSSACEGLVLDVLLSLSTSNLCREKMMSLGMCEAVEALAERTGDGGGWENAASVLKDKREKLVWQIKRRGIALERLKSLVQAAKLLQADVQKLPRKAGDTCGLLKDDIDGVMVVELANSCRWLISAFARPEDVVQTKVRASQIIQLRKVFCEWRWQVIRRKRLARTAAMVRRRVNNSLVAASFLAWHGEGDALAEVQRERDALMTEREVILIERDGWKDQVAKLKRQGVVTEHTFQEERARAQAAGSVGAAVCGLVDHLLDDDQGKQELHARIMDAIANSIAQFEGLASVHASPPPPTYSHRSVHDTGDAHMRPSRHGFAADNDDEGLVNTTREHGKYGEQRESQNQPWQAHNRENIPENLMRSRHTHTPQDEKNGTSRDRQVHPKAHEAANRRYAISNEQIAAQHGDSYSLQESVAYAYTKQPSDIDGTTGNAFVSKLSNVESRHNALKRMQRSDVSMFMPR